MRVFLGNGPWYRPGYYGVRAGSRWPHFETECSPYLPFPFYLGYATALLQKNGHECCLVDGVAERISEDDFVARAAEFKPDLVVLEVSTPSLETDLRQAGKIKAACPNAMVAFAGLLITEEEDFLANHPDIDLILVGEYDYILLETANRIQDQSDFKDVAGLVFRSPETGETVTNPRRSAISNLDELPWPCRDQLPMHSYHDLPGGIPAPSLQMWASRGCPFGCVFCVWPQVMYGGSCYHTRNPVDVVDEIEYCVNRWGFRSYYFDDDTFNIGKPRLMALAETIKQRDLKLPWAAMSRADTTDRETLKNLKEAGLVAVKYGVESASQDLVDRANKSLDLGVVEQAVRYTQELGIRIHLTFSFGLPGETHETALKTIRWSQKLNPDSVQYSIMTPFPGSRFYKQLEAAGHLMTKDWSKFDGNTMAVIRTEALESSDLENYIRMAYRKWEWHRFRRAFYQPRYMGRALRHPIRNLQNFWRGLESAQRN